MISKIQLGLFSLRWQLFPGWHCLDRLNMSVQVCTRNTKLKIVDTENLHTVIILICVYPHAKFQVIPVSNVKYIRDFPIYGNLLHTTTDVTDVLFNI